VEWIVENIGILVPAAIAVASAISAFVPSGNKIMQVIDLIALNWNKARNDPEAQ
jgi:hypothetical protein